MRKLKEKRTSIVAFVLVIAMMLTMVPLVGFSEVHEGEYVNKLDWFAEHVDSHSFDDALCATMVDIACAAYNKQDLEQIYTSLGFQKMGTYNHVDKTSFQSSIGLKTTFGNNNIVLIDIRGTGSIKDLLCDVSFLGRLGGSFFHHAGFDQVAKWVFDDLLSDFVDKYDLEGDKKTFYFVTGHSLGAAVGNLLSAKLNDRVGSQYVYSYNFACPNTTIIDKSIYDRSSEGFNFNGEYSNIFNICHRGDWIAHMPGSFTATFISVGNAEMIFSGIGTGSLTKFKWGKLGITKWFDDHKNSLTDNNHRLSHDQTRYQDYINRSRTIYVDSDSCPSEIPYPKDDTNPASNTDEDPLSPEDDPLSPFYKPKKGDAFPFHIIGVFCPVDIEVSDETGAVVAYTNNHIPYYNDYENDLLIMVSEDRTCIVYPSNSNGYYSIRLRGTDNGEMLVIVGESYADDLEQAKAFGNVVLNEGKTMSLDIDETEIQSSKLYAIDSEGERIKEIHEDGTETKIGVTDLNVNSIMVERDEDDFVIEPGSSKQIKALFQNADGDIIEKVASWTSSNEQIATVSPTGLVTAISEGSVTIAVSVDDQSMDIPITVGKKADDTNPSTTPSIPTPTPSENNEPVREGDGDSTNDMPLLTGIEKGPDGKWAMYKDGKVDTSYTGIAKNKYGWWRVEKGYVNFKANGIYKNQYGWWKTTDGKVTFDETGVFKNEYGWWRVKDSKVDFEANGIYKNQFGWWKTTKGKVTFKENSVFKNEHGWWKVKDAKVDFYFTGIAKNKYGSWYVKNGKVDFNKNGKVTYNGTTYTVKNGKVQ